MNSNDFDMEMDQEDGSQDFEQHQNSQNQFGSPQQPVVPKLGQGSVDVPHLFASTPEPVAFNPSNSVSYVTRIYPSLPPTDYAEWSYKMRRNMQEVLPNLFLGPYASATKSKLDDMKAAGLTHVVCVRQILERKLIRPNHPETFHYHVVEFADTLVDNIIPHFKGTNKFIEDALTSGGKVLVHGNGGVSRSAALVIAYIMSRFGVTCKEAFAFVQSRRFCINPNENFLSQLREFEPIYQAFHTVPLPLPTMESNDFQHNKRPLEEEEDNATNHHDSKARAVGSN